MRLLWVGLFAAALLSAMTARAGGAAAVPSATAAPSSYCNCARQWQPSRPPQRILALNQHAADLLLALGAGERLQGVSWLDDDAEAARSGRYHGVPVISRHYPGLEAVLALESDFLVGGFASAFMPGRGPAAREQLAVEGIGSYLLEDGCGPARCSSGPFAGVLHDLRTLGSLLGREERAETLAARFEAALETARALPLPRLPRPLRVMIFDSDLRAPIVEGGAGFVTALLALSGVDNAFADLAVERGSVSWEEVLARDPDVILLIDATWSSAAAKRRFLAADPVLASLSAVRAERFVELRFSAAMAGLASVDELPRLGAELQALAAAIAGEQR